MKPRTDTPGLRCGNSLAAGVSVTLELNSGDVVYAIRSGGADAVLSVLRAGRPRFVS
jgi:hypothetical protein